MGKVYKAVLSIFVIWTCVQLFQGKPFTTCPSGRFGPDCRYSCHCQSSCDSTTGYCHSKCTDSWSGLTCQRYDTASGSETMQRIGKNTSSSTLAVDGNASTCSMTPRGVTGWWRADLGQVYGTLKVLVIANISTNGWKILIGETERFEEMVLCNVLGNDSSDALLDCGEHGPARFVAVLNPHGYLVLCQLSAYVCAPFQWGQSCEHQCACSDEEERCDLQEGFCVSGCRPGRLGEQCSEKCNMTYGINCSQPCGHCLGNGPCNIESGACEEGCDPGWMDRNCDKECSQGYYGSECQDICGNCHDEKACLPTNGHCPRGCSAGWTGSICKTGCPFGRYGANCSVLCGHCKEVSRCNPVNGMCETGCRPGWQGWNCMEVCPSGTYGADCDQFCETCKEGECNPETGHCMTECIAGWKGLTCDTECPSGYFGETCVDICGKCNYQKACEPSTGACLNGCQPGYHGNTCKEECLHGYYGTNCSASCGYCQLGEPCDKVTGVCKNGCVIGYHGSKCEKVDTFTDNTRPFYRVVLGLMVTVVGVVMLLVIICLIINWRREDLSSYDVIQGSTNQRQDLINVESNTLDSEANNDSGHMTDEMPGNGSREANGSLNNLELQDL